MGPGQPALAGLAVRGLSLQSPTSDEASLTGMAAKQGQAGASPGVNHPAHAQHSAHLTPGVCVLH